MVEIKRIKRKYQRGRNVERKHIKKGEPGHLYIIALCGHFAPITQSAELMDSVSWRCVCEGLLYYGMDTIVVPAGNAEVIQFTSRYAYIFAPGL